MFASREQTGYVYFAVGEGYNGGKRGLVKIGFMYGTTTNAEKVGGLRGHLLALAEGTPKDEAALHRHFSWCHARGDWFYPTQHLMAVLLDLTRGFTVQQALRADRRFREAEWSTGHSRVEGFEVEI